MKVKFCGAAGEVTGSAHLLTLNDGFTILLDCGLYQGHSENWKDFNENWLFDPSSLDCMLLSHAHIDHTGRIPKLVKDGFKGNIYCTHATRNLCTLMLMDSARIQESEATYHNKKMPNKAPKQPLYDENDAKNAMRQFVGLDYENWFQIHPDVWVLFRDMGHILGSASITLYIKEGEQLLRFGFTGDIGRPNRPILRDPQPMPPVDFLISESTYGDKLHESAPDELMRFRDIIASTVLNQKGKVIIPAFSVGRTQEIVYMLDRLVSSNQLPKIPVFIDSPLAINATQFFKQHLECYDDELHNYMLSDGDPFGFNSLHYVQSTEESKSLNDKNLAGVIIASSGMGNTGRVKHHIANSVEDARNTILIVGYCSADTPGGQLKNGVQQLTLFEKNLRVRAKVEVMDSFSAHADQAEMLALLANQKDTLQKIFLVHGDPDAQVIYKDYLTHNGFKDIVIPKLGDEAEISLA
jgi:metallo-beta-lactamase family protein